MRDAFARRQASGTPHRIDMVGAVALHAREIEPFEDAKRQQELESLARRRQRVDGQAAIGRRQRLLPRGLDRQDVVERQGPAELLQVRDDRAPELAAVKQVRSAMRERLQRPRKVGLADDLSERDRFRRVGLRPVVIERRIDLQQRKLLVDLRDAELGDREAIARDRDRGLQRLAERLLPVRADELRPAGEIAGRRNRERPALQILAPREALHGEPARHARHEIERAHAPLLRDVARRKAEAGEART